MMYPIVAVAIVIATVVIYFLFRKLYLRYPYPILLPVVTSTVFILLILLFFNISYEDYLIGGEWLSRLMGPAIVALAFPLYKQRVLVLRYSVMIGGAVLIGVFLGFSTVYGLALLFQFNDILVATVLPKSITAPVAVEISAALHGLPPLTATFVLVAGFSGILIGPWVMQKAGIRSLYGKSIALGGASHAMGISKAAEYGNIPLSMSSIAMTLSAIVASLFIPIFIWIF
ncbi:LrgB family protein [Shouchella lehensis]|uniref:LrgB family protein n=2 Tax=Shouchella lehensis TaxID=300825 RepID=A0A060LR02_9BACI|nr:LrgB family protein [Shouchella lehensis]AIC93711.1 hypothetical protein BleG1_1108 [Shouchella lehensis G1]MBG9782602.1 hypothetical protein [Shouchella lehensis]RQW21941.1 LrgB family protein [Bacillus sp. C1-1]TES47782.1 LrgB family protein [Shouchella lehensis]